MNRYDNRRPTRYTDDDRERMRKALERSDAENRKRIRMKRVQRAIYWLAVWAIMLVFYAKCSGRI